MIGLPTAGRSLPSASVPTLAGRTAGLTRRPTVEAQKGWREHRSELAALPLAERFTRIHDLNLWGADQSRSGLGSEPDATLALRESLPRLLRRLRVGSVLDLPCGDGGWLIDLLPPDVRYTGIDIVPTLIERLQARYDEEPERRFAVGDVLEGGLPRADLVICRDLLVHLSLANVRTALRNIAASGTSWVLTTNFPSEPTSTDIEDGDWRPINLKAAPFGLPEPDVSINERCTEGGGGYADKSLALWPASCLPAGHGGEVEPGRS